MYQAELSGWRLDPHHFSSQLTHMEQTPHLGLQERILQSVAIQRAWVLGPDCTRSGSCPTIGFLRRERNRVDGLPGSHHSLARWGHGLVTSSGHRQNGRAGEVSPTGHKGGLTTNVGWPSALINCKCSFPGRVKRKQLLGKWQASLQGSNKRGRTMASSSVAERPPD